MFTMPKIIMSAMCVELAITNMFCYFVMTVISMLVIFTVTLASTTPFRREIGSVNFAVSGLMTISIVSLEIFQKCKRAVSKRIKKESSKRKLAQETTVFNCSIHQ